MELSCNRCGFIIGAAGSNAMQRIACSTCRVRSVRPQSKTRKVVSLGGLDFRNENAGSQRMAGSAGQVVAFAHLGGNGFDEVHNAAVFDGSGERIGLDAFADSLVEESMSSSASRTSHDSVLR